MKDDQVIFIRMRHRIQVGMNQKVQIGDVAQVVGHSSTREKITKLLIHEVVPKDKHLIVIDVMKVIGAIKNHHPGIDVQTIGGAQSILEISQPKKKLSIVYFALIWLLLFVGAALAIMNFHADVSMPSVHQKIYLVITGQEVTKPLLLQIPYSFGLGLGMILFFNHVFRKRLNEEPSPLEIEMHNYQQALDQYIALHENSESEKKINDR